ncbi:MAG: transglutaminase domain-containing protein [Patescibacteria group bacterium]|nr:transglutaminase domain-containing protein [Patescibacteria group bacterium]
MHATALESSYTNGTPTDVFAGNPFYPLSIPPVVCVYPLADGTDGTFQTLDAMAQCVRGEVSPDFSGWSDSWIQKTASAIVGNAPGDCYGKAKRILDFVKTSIQYLPHPINEQIVQDCRRTIEARSGDCVSMSVCIATLMASLGYMVRFVVQFPEDLTGYSHVYAEVRDETGVWIAMDGVATDKPLGWSQSLPSGGFETTYEIF